MTARQVCGGPAKSVLNRIGDASRKIFIADGGRYSTPTTPTDVDLNYDGSLGGPFSDIGPFTAQTRSWNHSHARGNGTAGGTDARIYACRHGAAEQNKSTDACRFNAGYFDGHVEEHACPNGAMKGAVAYPARGEPKDPTPGVAQGCVDQAECVAARQGVLAALRLADLLNESPDARR